MSKIKICTDSASDVSVELANELGIDLLCFPITVGDKGYREHVDFTTKEFYEILENAQDLPHTSQVTVMDYTEVYEKNYEKGYTDLIVVTIASIGSNSNNNANMARTAFYEEHPEAEGKYNIVVIDSKSYTGGYGLPVIEAARKVQKGAEADEIIAFLNDWFESVFVYCTAFTLKYAKKSGRVNCVAAFVGEVLGLRPIIRFTDAVSETLDKVRGDKAVCPKMVDLACDAMVPQTQYAVLVGSNEELAEEVAELMTKKVGYGPTEYIQVGATIACHLGHDVSGIIVKGPNRGK